MGNLLTSLMLVISVGVFNAVSGIYSLFYGLATARLFNNATIQSVSNNVYVLVSVVILFAFSVKLIEAIVNPDLLTDAKKGVTGVLKRTIIGLLLIVAVPAIFNFVYYLQAEIIVGGLVEKIVLGYVDSDSEAGIEGAGGELTSTIITSFIIPIDENGVAYSEYGLCGGVDSCNYADKLLDANPEYEPYVSFLGGNPQYDRLTKIKPDKEWENGEPIYQINGLALVVVGCFVLYQIIILCMDAGLRLVKLGMLEVIAPIVIVSYIASGADHLSKWAKMTVQEFTSILIRIAGLCFMVLGFRLMNAPDSIFNNDSVSFWFKVFLIIGLLRMIKEMPDMFGKLFGANIKMGSIKDKLGEMAGIGKMAQNAWGAMGGLAKSSPQILAAAGRGIGRGVRGLDNKIENKFGKSLGSGIRNMRDKASSKIDDNKVLSKVKKGAGAVGRTARNAASYARRGAKVAHDVYKDGGKDTYGTLTKSGQTQFKTELANMARADAERKEARLNGRLVLASGQQLVRDKDNKNKIDHNATAIAARNSNKLSDINKKVIDNMSSLSGGDRSRLTEFNEKSKKAHDTNRKVELKDDVTSGLDELYRLTKNVEQGAELKKLINSAKNDNGMTAEMIKSRLAEIGKNTANNAIPSSQFEDFAEKIFSNAKLAEKEGALAVSDEILKQDAKNAQDKVKSLSEKIKEYKESLKDNTAEYDAFDSVYSTIDKNFQAMGYVERAGLIKEQPKPVETFTTAQEMATTGSRPGAVQPAPAAESAPAAEPAPATETQGRPGGATTPAQQAAFNQQNSNTTIINNNTAPAAEPTPAQQAAPAAETTQQAAPAPAAETSTGGSVGGTVKAEIDTSGLETKLGELGDTFKQGSSDIVRQVQTSSGEIKTSINNAADILNKTNSNMQDTNNALDDIKKAAKDTNEKLDDNNKKDDE